MSLKITFSQNIILKSARPYVIKPIESITKNKRPRQIPKEEDCSLSKMDVHI